MYKFVGKPGKMYFLDLETTTIKLNYNCPDSEKVGSGPGSCGGSKENKSDNNNKPSNTYSGNSLRSLMDTFGKLSENDTVDKNQMSELSKGFTNLISSKTLDNKSEKRAMRFLDVINNQLPENMKHVPGKSIEVNKTSEVPSKEKEPPIKKEITELDLKQVSASLSTDEKNVLHKYSIEDSDDIETSYEYINTYIKNLSDAPKETKEAIKQIDGIMKKTSIPGNITVYSGVSNNIASSILKSGKYEPNEFLSTSLDKKIAYDFGEKYCLELKLPKGTRGVFLDETISDVPNEKELLLDRNQNYGVLSTRKEDNRTIITLTKNSR